MRKIFDLFRKINRFDLDIILIIGILQKLGDNYKVYIDQLNGPYYIGLDSNYSNIPNFYGFKYDKSFYKLFENLIGPTNELD